PEVGTAYWQLVLLEEPCRLGDDDVWDRDRFRRSNYVDAMSLVRKGAWAAVEGYTPMHGWEDYDLWCKFIEAGFIGIVVPEILCRYRVHKSSMLMTETLAKIAIIRRKMSERHRWLVL